MVKFLSSIRTAYYALLALIVWFALGVLLSQFKEIETGIKSMNYEMIFDWILNNASKNFWGIIWIVGFFVISTFLTLNLLVCTYMTMFRTIKTKSNLKALILFGVHLMFIIIVVFHVLSFVIGSKEGNVKMYPGESSAFPGGYTFVIDKVNFVDDLKILDKKDKSSRKEMSKDNFTYKENYAEFSVFQNGTLLISEKVYVMQPLKFNDIRITLEKFISPDKKNTEVPGVNMAFSSNMFIEVFFVVYGIEILLILAYTVLTWKKK